MGRFSGSSADGNDEKSRIVEETLMPRAVACEVARRHGVTQEPALHMAKAGASS